jgi:hypothetical protein
MRVVRRHRSPRVELGVERGSVVCGPAHRIALPIRRRLQAVTVGVGSLVRVHRKLVRAVANGYVGARDGDKGHRGTDDEELEISHGALLTGASPQRKESTAPTGQRKGRVPGRPRTRARSTTGTKCRPLRKTTPWTSPGRSSPSDSRRFEWILRQSGSCPGSRCCLGSVKH